MQKTKLGVSVGVLGSLLCFICLFGDYAPIILLGGYILLMEENEWLRKTTVKAIATILMFIILSSVVKLIPNVISVIDDIFSIFGGSFYLSFISNLVEAICDIIYLIEKLLFLGLGFKALNQGTIPIPMVDQFVEKNM